jgi:hypothetical protein
MTEFSPRALVQKGGNPSGERTRSRVESWARTAGKRAGLEKDRVKSQVRESTYAGFRAFTEEPSARRLLTRPSQRNEINKKIIKKIPWLDAAVFA